jgi:hypothetical protein
MAFVSTHRYFQRVELSEDGLSWELKDPYFNRVKISDNGSLNNGDITEIIVYDLDGDQFEELRGTYVAITPAITRDQVYKSSNNDNKIVPGISGWASTVYIAEGINKQDEHEPFAIRHHQHRENEIGEVSLRWRSGNYSSSPVTLTQIGVIHTVDTAGGGTTVILPAYNDWDTLGGARIGFYVDGTGVLQIDPASGNHILGAEQSISVDDEGTYIELQKISSYGWIVIANTGTAYSVLP